MKIKISIVTAFLTLILSSCGASSISYRKIISPKGAPSLAFVKESKNLEYFETNDKASLVGAQLLNNEYGLIVFDFYNGLKTIKNSKTSKSPYKLLRTITSSNIYLLGIGEENNSLPKAGDRIVSFGENLLPDLVFKNIFSDTLSSYKIEYTPSGVSDILPVITTGKYSTEAVDYVVVAEPVMTRGIKVGTKNGLKYPYKASFKALWNNELPQAGLFINMEMYESHKGYFINLYNRLDESIKYSVSSYTKLADQMRDEYSTDELQKKTFGFTADEVNEIQAKNGFGMLEDEKDPNQTVNDFLNKLGITDDYSDYIVNPKELFK